MYYFAYGSNLNPRLLQKRCPDFIKYGVGVLEGYKLEFCGYSMRWRGGVATINPSAGGEVWGTLYKLNSGLAKRLDRYEGTRKKRYHKVQLSIKTADDKLVSAYGYARFNKPPSKPSKKYLGVIVEGAKLNHLPQSYIRQLESQR